MKKSFKKFISVAAALTLIGSATLAPAGSNNSFTETTVVSAAAALGTYRVTSSNGQNVRLNASTLSSIKGALGYGAVIKYDKIAYSYENGTRRTWYHISSVSNSGRNSWGRFTGYWVAKLH